MSAMAKLLVVVAALSVILGTQQIYAFSGGNPGGGEIVVGIDDWATDSNGNARVVSAGVRLPRAGAHSASVTVRACDGRVLATGVSRITSLRQGRNRVAIPLGAPVAAHSVCSTSLSIAQR
jgi:hypothetical protein